jgi:hypothetical protein
VKFRSLALATIVGTLISLVVPAALAQAEMNDAANRTPRRHAPPRSHEDFAVVTGVAGLGFAVTHEFVLRGKMSAGPYVTFDSGDTGSLGGTYTDLDDTRKSMFLDAQTEYQSIGFGLQTSYYSNVSSGWHLGFLLGTNRVVHSLEGSREVTVNTRKEEAENFSDSKTSWGWSGGVSLGYLWGFESGFNVGLVIKPVYTSAKLSTLNLPPSASFPSNPRLNTNENEMSASVLGLALGFAY